MGGGVSITLPSPLTASNQQQPYVYVGGFAFQGVSYAADQSGSTFVDSPLQMAALALAIPVNGAGTVAKAIANTVTFWSSVLTYLSGSYVFYFGEIYQNAGAPLGQAPEGSHTSGNGWTFIEYANGGDIDFGAGQYKVGSLGNLYTLGPRYNLHGAGGGACKFLDYGNGGDLFRIYDPFFSVDGNGATGNGARFGIIEGFVIDGANSQGARNAIHYGDILDGHFSDLVIQNYDNNAGACGILMDNTVGFCERTQFDNILVTNSDSPLIFTIGGVNGSGSAAANSSFDYSKFTNFHFSASAASYQQLGVQVLNGSRLDYVDLDIRANFTKGATNTAAILTIAGFSLNKDQPTGNGTISRITSGRLDVRAEADGGGATGPITVTFGTGNGGTKNAIQGMDGVMQFSSGLQTSNWDGTASQMGFEGPIIGDTVLTQSGTAGSGYWINTLTERNIVQSGNQQTTGTLQTGGAIRNDSLNTRVTSYTLLISDNIVLMNVPSAGFSVTITTGVAFNREYVIINPTAFAVGMIYTGITPQGNMPTGASAIPAGATLQFYVTTGDLAYLLSIS